MFSIHICMCSGTEEAYRSSRFILVSSILDLLGRCSLPIRLFGKMVSLPLSPQHCFYMRLMHFSGIVSRLLRLALPSRSSFFERKGSVGDMGRRGIVSA